MKYFLTLKFWLNLKLILIKIRYKFSNNKILIITKKFITLDIKIKRKKEKKKDLFKFYIIT